MNEENKAVELTDEDLEKVSGGKPSGGSLCPHGREHFNEEYCVNTIHCGELDRITLSPVAYGCGWFGCYM